MDQVATAPVVTLPPLNQGQQAAADGFFQFLFGNDKELIISGPGGVGKTFLMGHLIDESLPNYFATCKMMGIPSQYDEVVMSATTNKAVEVLGAATGRPSETIHSFLNLKVVDDYASGRSIITKTNSWTVHKKKIVFVDECSMVDSVLRTYLNEGTHECKIVYVGDHCQLAPVMEKLSPIYRDGLPFYELTEQMRTRNVYLQALNQQLRNTVETGVFEPIQIVPGVIDWVTDEEMEREVQANFAIQGSGNRILSYTNKRVIQYNDHIRGIRNLPDSYVLGDKLINNNAIRMKSSMLSVEAEVEIVEMADQSEFIDIDDDVKLEFIRSTLQGSYGGYFTDVMLPVDRGHFAALIKYYQGRKNWNRYFFLKNNFPDLRQRDAATVHKAQGSSYDTVFIDVGNLSTCHQPDLAARLLYVACSRARNRVVLYGELAAKYGGLIK